MAEAGLPGVAAEALRIPVPEVEVTLKAPKTYVDTLPNKLGSELSFSGTGYVDEMGERYDEKTGKAEPYVKVKVTDLKIKQK